MKPPGAGKPTQPVLKPAQPATISPGMARNSFSLLGRFLTFRRELGILWRAFLAPETPRHLKALMFLVPLYLLSPVDLISDFLPFIGWLDDLVIVPLLVSWIVAMLPRTAPARPERGGPARAKVIEGTARRL
jgi:uncharacterized membrane protein YkvA (DUF1232 family)